MITTALRQASTGRPGPVYLDMPGDVLYKDVDEDSIDYREASASMSKARPQGDLDAVRAAIKLLGEVERPIVVSGTGIIWSEASAELRQFVELTGIPFYTTPQGRGVIPDDHPLSFMAARSTAFREADCIVIVGTRMNYVSSHFTPPRFRADAKVIQINIDPGEIGLSRPCDVGIIGDARAVLDQLVTEGQGKRKSNRYSGWVNHLSEIDQARTAEQEKRMSSDEVPIHPLRPSAEERALP